MQNVEHTHEVLQLLCNVTGYDFMPPAAVELVLFVGKTLLRPDSFVLLDIDCFIFRALYNNAVVYDLQY